MTPKYDERGLIPAVAQDARSGRILMLAWMNAQALELTTATGRATYWSRSRQALWVKGESSGHTQEVVDLRLDCDLDAVLMLVNQTGPACHTGETSCFFYDAEGTPCDPPSSGMIERLQGVLRDRKNSPSDASYTARLFHKGMPKIAEKIREEAEELIDALSNESDDRVVSEAADLLYHALVGLELRGVDAERVAQELSRRFGTSGLVEKARRK